MPFLNLARERGEKNTRPRRPGHISVAVDMRTLLDGTHFSSRTNGQVAARRVTGSLSRDFGVICTGRRW